MAKVAFLVSRNRLLGLMYRRVTCNNEKWADKRVQCCRVER